MVYTGLPRKGASESQMPPQTGGRGLINMGASPRKGVSESQMPPHTGGRGDRLIWVPAEVVDSEST